MLRSSRLMANELDEHSLLFRSDMKERGKWDVQPGDTMTGWEIMAGLPLEEQLVISIDGSGCIKDYIASTDSCDCDCAECFSERLNKLYRWNGESWEVVE